MENIKENIHIDTGAKMVKIELILWVWLFGY